MVSIIYFFVSCSNANSHILSYSSFFVVLLIMNARMIIPTTLNTNLRIANFPPSCVTSNNIIGILVVDQAPININILLAKLLFSKNTAATGNEAYNGPAEKSQEQKQKYRLLFRRLYPYISSLFLWESKASISPSKIKIGGMIDNISSKLSKETEAAFFSGFWANEKHTYIHNQQYKKKLVSFKKRFIS